MSDWTTDREQQLRDCKECSAARKKSRLRVEVRAAE
jgi:hypothetical protein